MALGYMNADGTIADSHRLLVAGAPASIGLHRSLTKNTEDVTWRANLDWTPNDDTLFYISATKGLRSGGFNLVFFSSNSTYDGEELISYEVGYKGTLLDGSMQINAAAYFYDYENVHTFVNGPSFAGGFTTNVVAVPEAEMYGMDLDVTWLATDYLTLGLHGSYTHSEYTSDILVINPNDRTRPETLFDAGSVQFNLNGNNMLRVPQYKAGAYAQYNWPEPLDIIPGRIDFLVNFSYIDRVYFTVFEKDEDSADSYTRLDLRATWNPNESWMVAAFFNNVLNEIGLRQIEQYGARESNNYRISGVPTDPRIAGVEIRFKFGAF